MDFNISPKPLRIGNRYWQICRTDGHRKIPQLRWQRKRCSEPERDPRNGGGLPGEVGESDLTLGCGLWQAPRLLLSIPRISFSLLTAVCVRTSTCTCLMCASLHLSWACMWARASAHIPLCVRARARARFSRMHAMISDDWVCAMFLHVRFLPDKYEDSRTIHIRFPNLHSRTYTYRHI